MSDRIPRRALGAVLSEHWAIKPEWLRTIAAVAQRQASAWDSDVESVRAAMMARRGESVKGARHLYVKDGIGVLPIMGPIFPHANIMTDMSGAVSLDSLAADFDIALEDPNVAAIVLDIDSPGGHASGINEFSSRVASARGVKPVVAYCGGMACSAAYWIASAAAEIVAERTAVVGSIGVVTAAEVQEGLDRDGYRQFDIVSSNAPQKRPDLKTEDGIESVRERLNALEAVFVAAVAENRGVDYATVVTTFGQGGVFIGAEAVQRNMADTLGGFAAALATAKQLAGAHIQPEQESRSMTTETKTDVDTAALLKAERARVSAIVNVGAENPGFDAIVAECVADEKATAGDCAVKILAARNKKDAEAAAKAKATSSVETMANDLPKSPLPDAPAAGLETAAALAGLPIDVRCERQWNASADLRAEFPTVGAYKAYEKAMASGKVKVLKTKAA